LLGVLLPDGSLHDILARSYGYGLTPPVSIDLWIFSISFGFRLNMNACGLIFMFLGLLLYKKA
jgi:short subunit fatty acids transporter